ncbi:MAG: tetratricopeptide (TPR) repeat protein [Planctomycetota bacterium]|jgi:tetratricopeptide (TPR) repeat protein
MTPKWSAILVGLCTLTVAPAFSQETDKTAGQRKVGGVARKISEILGGATIHEERSVELDDLAVSVEMALLEIDPDHISRLNREMGRLRDREEEISSQIEGLGKGLPFDFNGPARPFSPAEDVSEDALEMATNQLKARQLRIKELEIRRAERQKEVNAINDARTMTPLSSALLSTMEEIPDLKPLATASDESKSEFPGRMARALFKTGDFVGALKHFQLIEEAKLGPRDRYEMARCLEEAGEKEKALEVASRLVAETMATDEFWYGRGKNLVNLLKTILGIKIDQPKGKDA